MNEGSPPISKEGKRGIAFTEITDTADGIFLNAL